MEQINNFAKATLGKVPEIVGLLGNINEDLAMEQFRENQSLYLGRKSLDPKMLSLIAIAVSAANGQSNSVNIHFSLSKKFGTEPFEILDALKAAKMALMSSTMSTFKSSVPILEEIGHVNTKSEEATKIVNKIKAETGMEKLPENLIALSKFSFDLFTEHLKEKSELLSPFMLGSKSVYLISYAVSVSIQSEECSRTYLKQFLMAGGSIAEVEDALAVSRFITGNRAFITSIEMLRALATKPLEQ
ncbi:MAG: carboxymuconolactone decarboxylase family protein [Thermoplasmataceae archaeon]